MTSIILSGGNGKRMGGKEKAFLVLNGETFIQRKIRILSPFSDEIIIVVNNPDLYSGLPAKIITDLTPGEGPLMGLYSGLTGSSSEINFVTTVDSPFTNSSLAEFLIQNIGSFDAHVPANGQFIEPLFAVYRKGCEKAIERVDGSKKVVSFFKYIRVKYLKDSKLLTIDPKRESFININSMDDYRKIAQVNAPEDIPGTFTSA